MDKNAKQASRIIDSIAKAVANWTVDELAQADPDLPQRYGARWRGDWIGHTLSLIYMLAQAVSVRSQELFSHHVIWTFHSFEARGIPGADLIQNTKSMREVLHQQLPPPVAEMVSPFVDKAVNDLEEPVGTRAVVPAPEAEHSEPTLKYLEAILSADRAAAESMIIEAKKNGMSVAEIYELILAPAQARLGRMWHRGEITVADEHFGSATTQSVMSLLRPHFDKAPTNGRKVIATATPGDLHEIGLRMVADLFEVDGWNVIYLGANTPTDDLVEQLQRHHPDLLALSVNTGLTLREAGELIETIRESDDIADTKVLIGGPPFSAATELWREVGADGFAKSCSEAVTIGQRLISS